MHETLNVSQNYNIIIGTVCVSTLDRRNYTCRMSPVLDQSVVITGAMTQNDLGVLSDLVQTEVERYLVNQGRYKINKYCRLDQKFLS